MVARGSKAGQETAAELLAMAEEVMARARPETAGLWPRAAALLARQALEAALREFWRERGLDLEECGTRQQLICLREFVGQDAAGNVYASWTALAQACHHHPYDVTPSGSSLKAACDCIRGADLIGTGR